MFAALAALALLSGSVLGGLVRAAPAPQPVAPLPGQSLRVSALVAPQVVQRDGYTVSSYVWPLADRSTPVTSGFGLRASRPCAACNLFHYGTDFSWGLYGAEELSVARGTVVEVTNARADYGSFVRVAYDVHGDVFEAVYGHMIPGSQKVAVGQVVEIGQPLGLMGASGDATGPHLHFEVRYGGVPVDSLAWLLARVPSSP